MKLSRSNLILFSFCVPGFTFGVANLDSIPWHLPVVTLLGLSVFRSFDVFLFLVTLIALMVIIFFSIDQAQFGLIARQLLNYVAVILGGAYLWISKPSSLQIMTVMHLALVFNGTIAVLQKVSPVFYVFSNARFGGGRGVIGAFPEPTSYGIFCAFAVLLAVAMLRWSGDEETSKKARQVLVLSLASIVLLNQSTTAILVLLFFGLISMLRSARVLAVMAIAIALGFIFFDSYEHTRFGGVIKVVSSGGLTKLLMIDGSANERLSSIVGPYFGVLSNYFVPSDPFSYAETVADLKQASGGFFWYGGSDKIMNYVGTIVYELSLFGLILLHRYVISANFSWKDLDLILGILFLFSTSLPLAHGYALFFVILQRNYSLRG